MNFFEAMAEVDRGKRVSPVGFYTTYYKDSKNLLACDSGGVIYYAGDFNIGEEEIPAEWEIAKDHYSFQDAVVLMSGKVRMRPIGEKYQVALVDGVVKVFSTIEGNWVVLPITTELVNSKWVKV